MNVKSFLIIAMLLVGNTAFAQGFTWEVAFERRSYAEKPEDKLALQLEFPQYFGQLNLSKTLSLNYSAAHYVLKGDTVCSSSDPRANFHSVSYGYCVMQNNEGTSSYCMQSSRRVPAPLSKDPCAE